MTRRPPTGFRFALLAVVPVVLLAGASVPDDGSPDQRFLSGLRERGLYRLAEAYCLDRLGRPGLSERQRADLVVELSRSLAERAVGSPPEVRQPLWQRALKVTEDFAKQHPQNPRLLLVRFQGALGLLARGELARQEAELVAEREPLLDEARTQLRAAIGRLDKLAAEVKGRLSQWNPSGRGDTSELTSQQLASLEKNVQYQLARALRNQAGCYPSNSDDQANSLTQAIERLEPLAGLDPADPLAWKSRLDLIRSHRLLARYHEAARQLDALLAEKPPPSVELQARAEQMRLARATDKLSEAIDLMSGGRERDGVTSPELDYAWLETYLAAWRKAGKANDEANAAQWQAKASELVRRIEGVYGPYWTRRAEMLLASYVRASPDSSDLDMLVRAAESSFRSGRPDDALAAYDRARALAAKQGNPDRAFDLGYLAATIEHQRNRHDQALQRYRRIAVARPKHPRAAEAHRLAIYHAGQIAKRRPQSPPEPYATLLQEHLQTWPEEAGADRVRRQLGRLREFQGDWQGAIAAYRAISPNDAEYLAVVEATERCCQAWLSGRKSAGQSTDQIAHDAAAWFESLMLGPRGGLPERWSPLQRRAALAAARIRMNFSASGYNRAHAVLAAALRGKPDPPPQWKSAAEALLVFSLAGQGRHDEADKVLAAISAGSTRELLAMLQGLGRVAVTASPEVRSQLAMLQLRTVEMLRAGGQRLSQTEQQGLETVRARALADAGRIVDALEAYRSLSTAYPRDGAIQEAYAGLLLGREDRESIRRALDKWRELEKNSPPRSRRWFLAKYSVAKAHYLLDNQQQAAKLITLLQLLHPELGGPEMKAEFEQLLRRCRE